MYCYIYQSCEINELNSILECLNLFSGVKLSMTSFYFIWRYVCKEIFVKCLVCYPTVKIMQSIILLDQWIYEIAYKTCNSPDLIMDPCCNISVLWTVILTQYEATTPSLTSMYLGPCAIPCVLINLDHGDL